VYVGLIWWIDEPIVKGAYMITTPIYFGTTQYNTNTHAAAQINPNKETSNNVVWKNGPRPKAKY
jgi:hypothetical protein